LVAVVACALAAVGRPAGAAREPRAWTFRSVDELKMINGAAQIVTYRGRHAVHLVPDRRGPADTMSAILADSEFTNGTIEAELAGAPLAGSPDDARGFIGVSFRVQANQSRYENVYIRPTNGRADDQLRRNHSVQYTSEPEFPWHRLRQESPGKYESY